MNPLTPYMLWIKIIGVLVICASFFAGGFALEHNLKNGEIAAINLQHQTDLNAALAAKNAAEEHSAKLEHDAGINMAELANAYEGKLQHEKDLNNRTIADLRDGTTQLHVSTTHSGCGAVPTTGASPGGSNGEAFDTLTPTVAARLAGRYADYNQVVNQLQLCQDVLDADRKEINGEGP